MRRPSFLKRPRTLSSLLTAYAGGGLFLLAAVFGVVLQLSVSRFLNDALRDKAEALARQLAVVALDAVLLRDYGTLERYVSDLVRERDVLWVQVRRDDGDILGEARGGDASSTTQGKRVVAPIQLLDDRIGEVSIEYDRGRVGELVIVLTLIGVTGIFILTLVLFLVVRRMLERHLITPIHSLARQVSPLHPRDAIVPRPEDPEEIQQLAAPFNRLRAEIDQYTERLEEAGRITRAATERLCREQRLATVGQLAAGLAHGLNTPLGNIAGYTQMALRHTGEPHTRERLEVVARQAEACSGIVRNLMTAARQPNPVGTAVDIVELVQATVGLIFPLLRDQGVAGIDVLVDARQVTAWADPAALEQILFNLLNNAAHAGCRRISLSVNALPGAVIVRVSDDGQGIPMEIQASLFEPFRTSKPPGQGTGLGLYMAATLVRAMGGDIALVESSPGRTTFEISLAPYENGTGPVPCTRS